MTIKTFDNSNIKEFLDACEKALKPVAERFGLDLERKSCTYHKDVAPVAFKVLTRGENGEDREKAEWDRYCARFGLKPEDYGRTFTLPRGGGEHTICGIKPRSSMYPVLARSSNNGKTYKFTSNIVIRGLDDYGYGQQIGLTAFEAEGSK